MRSLVIHGGDHRYQRLAVGKAQHRYLRSGQELLYHDACARVAEYPLLHDRVYRSLRLLACLRYRHALAQSQSVRLDDCRERAAFDILQRRPGAVKYLVGSRRYMVLLHELLGEDLACLYPRRLRVRSECRYTRRTQRVHSAQRQRIVGSHDGIADIVLLRKLHHPRDVRRRDVHALGIRRDTAVARERVYPRDLGAFLELLYDRMLAASAAHYHDVHIILHASDLATLPDAGCHALPVVLCLFTLPAQ